MADYTGYRQTLPHIGWILFENAIREQYFKLVAPGVPLGANGQPGSNGHLGTS